MPPWPWSKGRSDWAENGKLRTASPKRASTSSVGVRDTKEGDVSWQAKTASAAVLIGSYASLGDILIGDLGLAIVLVAAIAAWRYVDGFWRIVVAGLVGGAVAGLLILGPGFRLAMRAVAIMDPVHPEEFSIGGTFFIVVGFGAIVGGLTGIGAHLARRAFGISSAVIAGSLLAALELGALTFFSGDVSRELFDLGVSPWINIPLFGLYILGYGIAAMAVADKAETTMFSRHGSDREKVPA